MKKKMWIGMKGSRWKEILLLWGGFSKLTVDLRCSVVVMFGSKIRSWEKERRRNTWDREKREGKGAPERHRNKWALGISGLGSEGKVARSDLFSGVRLSFYLGLWSKLMWLFWTDNSYLLVKKHQIWGWAGIPETLYTFSLVSGHRRYRVPCLFF